MGASLSQAREKKMGAKNQRRKKRGLGRGAPKRSGVSNE